MGTHEQSVGVHRRMKPMADVSLSWVRSFPTNQHNQRPWPHLAVLWQYGWMVASSWGCAFFRQDSRANVWPSLELERTQVTPLGTSALPAAFGFLVNLDCRLCRQGTFSYGLEDQTEWCRWILVLLGLTSKHSAKPSRIFFSSLANMILLEFLILTPITIMCLQWASFLTFLKAGFLLPCSRATCGYLPSTWPSLTEPSLTYTIFP